MEDFGGFLHPIDICRAKVRFFGVNLWDFGVKKSNFGLKNSDFGVFSYTFTAVAVIGFFMGFLGLGIWDFLGVFFLLCPHSPSGKKFRSKPQLARYLGNAVDLSCFDFRTGKMMPSKLQKNKQRLRNESLHPNKVRWPFKRTILEAGSRPYKAPNPILKG